MGRYGLVAGITVSRLWSPVRPIAALVSGLLRGPTLRATKLAIAMALKSDKAIAALIPAAQIFSVERSTIPVLPAVELVGVTSEGVGDGPTIRHLLSVEITVAHSGEDAADELLAGLVLATRRRLGAAEHGRDPIALAGGGGILIELRETRWSISATASAGVIRGAAVAVAAVVVE